MKLKIIICILIALVLSIGAIGVVLSSAGIIDVRLTTEFGDCMELNDILFHYTRWVGRDTQISEFKGWYDAWVTRNMC